MRLRPHSEDGVPQTDRASATRVAKNVARPDDPLAEQKARLAAMPVRDLKADPRSRALLAAHPVYVSMTTTPSRIDSIQHTLETLDLTHVKKVLVVIPKAFGRTGEAYRIPASLKANPKVQVMVVPEDLGPITKMLPALERVKAEDPGGVVISIDDDVGYPRGMVNEMIYGLANHDRTVVSGATPSITRYSVDARDWRFPGEPLLAEGFAGIGYRARDVDTAALRRLHALTHETRFSDDVVISFVLAQSGVQRLPIHNEFHHRKALALFEHGFNADALHRGSGLQSAPSDEDFNHVKYRRALAALNRAVELGGAR